ncbi:site-specific integrase [Blastochloris sulfoviridis]|uniref:Tyrosine-type recombinase/integrase n=1 Tax=Blastochloris sulfoviridis TaxID=50712 RepID=A0A5M6HN79_9HYPH|nr:site-specific integrase [Blastochloris sulfoviridis]KAA5597247.1 tyrosine-type recombinase/integrase [Blastochloris sulfoviridis]
MDQIFTQRQRGYFVRMKNLTRNKAGVYVFRKAVPESLRPFLGGKWEWKLSLDTKDEDVALLRAAHFRKTVVEPEAKLAKRKREQAANPGAIAIFENAREIAAEVSESLPDWSLAHEAILRKHGMLDAEELSEALSRDPDNPKLKAVSKALAIAQGSKVKVQFTIKDSLALYLKTRKLTRKAELERSRIIDDLISYMKGDRPIERVSRIEARAYMESLSDKGYAPGSVNKQLGFIQAMFTTALREMESKEPNPWVGIKALDDEADNEKRYPFTLDQAGQVIGKLDTCNDDLRRIGLLTAFTGARLGEIAGLDAADVNLKAGVITIQENAHRRLKNKSSKRTIPIIGPAIEELKGLPASGPLFPRYAGKSDIASAALMKMVRKRAKITDEKLTWHSWRHLAKDLMREAEVSEDNQLRLLGHAGNGVSFNYGKGVSIGQLREDLERAYAPLLEAIGKLVVD